MVRTFRTTTLVSLALAAAGFSYALATTGSSRGTGTVPNHPTLPTVPPVAFCNPYVTATADRDLGDAVPGNLFHRYIHGRGGIPPYKITAGSLDTSHFFLGIGGFFDTPLAGKVRPPLAADFPLGSLRFMTSIKARGTNSVDNEPFRLSVVSDSRFRFAIGPNLNDATQIRKYSDKLSVINPTGELTFQLVGSAMLNGVAQTSLASLGFGLTKHEGVVFGQPLQSGTITFTVSCTDASGNVALSRDGSTVNQTFSINVNANKVASSDSMCMGLTIKVGKSGATIKYKGIFNINGTISSLAGKPASLRVGNFVSPVAYFDNNGTATNAIGKNSTGQTTITAKVGSNGILTITVTNADLTTTDVLDDPSHRDWRVNVADSIGTRSSVVGGDVGDTSIDQFVSSTSKSSSSSASSLSFSGASTAAGTFLVLSAVSGHDDKTGAGDKWKVTFVANPPTGTDLSSVASAQVGVGNLGNQLDTTSRSTLIVAHLKTDASTRNAVKSFSLSTKTLKGSYITTYLDAAATGLPVSGASFSGDDPSYTTQLVFDDSAGNSIFSGAGAITIFPKKNAWTSTTPK